MHAPVTSSMPAGGDLRFLSSPKSFLLIESSAAAAAIRAGSAASRSFWIEAFIAKTSASFLVAASAMMLALAASAPAFSFSDSSFGTITFTDWIFSSTSIAFTLSSSCSRPTDAAVVLSLSTPFT